MRPSRRTPCALALTIALTAVVTAQQPAGPDYLTQWLTATDKVVQVQDAALWGFDQRVAAELRLAQWEWRIGAADAGHDRTTTAWLVSEKKLPLQTLYQLSGQYMQGVSMGHQRALQSASMAWQNVMNDRSMAMQKLQTDLQSRWERVAQAVNQQVAPEPVPFEALVEAPPSEAIAAAQKKLTAALAAIDQELSAAISDAAQAWYDDAAKVAVGPDQNNLQEAFAKVGRTYKRDAGAAVDKARVALSTALREYDLDLEDAR